MLADQEFDIKDSVSLYCATIKIPFLGAAAGSPYIVFISTSGM